MDAPPPLEVQCVPVDDGRWTAFVQQHRDATPFHHPLWALTLAEAYGFRPFGLLLNHSGAAPSVGLPVLEVAHLRARRRWVTLPFTDHCPPLGNTSSSAVTAALNAARRGGHARSFEIRARLQGEGAHAGRAALGHVLALSRDEEHLFRTFHKSQVQRNIRRSEREGVRVRISTRESDLVSLFFRLHVLTRKRLGVPVQPRRYFQTLWRRVFNGGLGFVVVATVQDIPVAAGVFLAYNHTVIYKYGASDPVYWSARPNHALFWKAITWGCRKGFQHFDFGRTDHADEGLRRFKSQWGTEERPLDTTIIADQLPSPRRIRVPDGARSLIRRSPDLVPRALGRLYRYSA